MLQVQYMHQSGFIVTTDHACLVFDYDAKTPLSLDTTAGKEIFFFVSHGHFDHYSPQIFDYRLNNPSIFYVLSYDVPTYEKAVFVDEDEDITLGGARIRTLASTDEGVAFLVNIDGYTIYHSGDLNWWHWEGEDDAFNRNMAHRYGEQIQKLKGETINLAFVPVDLRLDEAYLWGLDALMHSADVRFAVPMHFWEDARVFDRLLSDSRADAYRHQLVFLPHSGDTAVLDAEQRHFVE